MPVISNNQPFIILLHEKAVQSKYVTLAHSVYHADSSLICTIAWPKKIDNTMPSPTRTPTIISSVKLANSV